MGLSQEIEGISLKERARSIAKPLSRAGSVVLAAASLGLLADSVHARPVDVNNDCLTPTPTNLKIESSFSGPVRAISGPGQERPTVIYQIGVIFKWDEVLGSRYAFRFDNPYTSGPSWEPDIVTDTTQNSLTIYTPTFTEDQPSPFPDKFSAWVHAVRPPCGASIPAVLEVR